MKLFLYFLALNLLCSCAVFTMRRDEMLFAQCNLSRTIASTGQHVMRWLCEVDPERSAENTTMTLKMCSLSIGNEHQIDTLSNKERKSKNLQMVQS